MAGTADDRHRPRGAVAQDGRLCDRLAGRRSPPRHHARRPATRTRSSSVTSTTLRRLESTRRSVGRISSPRTSSPYAESGTWPLRPDDRPVKQWAETLLYRETDRAVRRSFANRQPPVEDLTRLSVPRPIGSPCVRGAAPHCSPRRHNDLVGMIGVSPGPTATSTRSIQPRRSRAGHPQEGLTSPDRPGQRRACTRADRGSTRCGTALGSTTRSGRICARRSARATTCSTRSSLRSPLARRSSTRPSCPRARSSGGSRVARVGFTCPRRRASPSSARLRTST